MRSHWKIWIDAKTEDKVRRILERLHDQLGRATLDLAVEPYGKTGGFIVTFELDHSSVTWNDRVVEVIATGQALGFEWRLGGDVREDPGGWCERPRISGVRAIEWTLIRPRPVEGKEGRSPAGSN